MCYLSSDALKAIGREEFGLCKKAEIRTSGYLPNDKTILPIRPGLMWKDYESNVFQKTSAIYIYSRP